LIESAVHCVKPDAPRDDGRVPRFAAFELKRVAKYWHAQKIVFAKSGAFGFLSAFFSGRGRGADRFAWRGFARREASCGNRSR
jgi:hypothetical protein